MGIFNTFSDKAPIRVFIAIVFGAVSGVMYSLLIPLVLMGIQPEDPAFASVDSGITYFMGIEIAQYKIAALFFLICLLILLIRTTSEVMLTRVSTEVTRDIRISFYERLAKAPIEAIEKIGTAKIVATLNMDVPRILSGGRAVPALIVNGITIIGMLGFLVYLNPDIFKMVLMAILFGMACYQVPMTIGRKLLQKTREDYDELQEGLRGLIYGAKELKLDREKRKTYLESMLLGNEKVIEKTDKKAQTIMRMSSSFGDLLSFFVIGVTCFVFVNYHAIATDHIVGVVMTLLYIAGPISIILSAIPELATAGVSYKKLVSIVDALPDEGVRDNLGLNEGLDCYDLKNVVYQYPAVDGEPGFKVGPVDLGLSKGEITFIVGGNGSGKSTLAKILTLHYRATGGDLYINNEKVTQENIVHYRNKIAAIFTDYFLFKNLLIKMSDKIKGQIEHYLDELKLSEKVTLKEDGFSTLSLSDGQKKRLALLVSFVEDKELYLFDEWAADQDPEFRAIFYQKILPMLKSSGKMVVVITHDDRYFDLADNLVVMERGVVVRREEKRLQRVSSQDVVEV